MRKERKREWEGIERERKREGRKEGKEGRMAIRERYSVTTVLHSVEL